MCWAKARAPEENKCGLSEAALIWGRTPSARGWGGSVVCVIWQWAPYCRSSWESSQAGSCSLASSCPWLCCCSFSLPTSGSSWWRVSEKPHTAGVRVLSHGTRLEQVRVPSIFLGGLEPHTFLICRCFSTRTPLKISSVVNVAKFDLSSNVDDVLGSEGPPWAPLTAAPHRQANCESAIGTRDCWSVSLRPIDSQTLQRVSWSAISTWQVCVCVCAHVPMCSCVCAHNPHPLNLY